MLINNSIDTHTLKKLKHIYSYSKLPQKTALFKKRKILILISNRIYEKEQIYPHQIGCILKEFEKGKIASEICREHGVSTATFYKQVLMQMTY